jgi:ATP-dependent RNA helicase DHX37/DHR1
VFEHQFAPFALPQILCSPIEGILLQMKAMAIPDVRHFPYPTPPDEDDIERALNDEEVTQRGACACSYLISSRACLLIFSLI